jgi:hypothetical protein
MSPANRNLSSDNTLDGTATTAILPVVVPNTSHRWARGVRAGGWSFATGLLGQTISTRSRRRCYRAATPSMALPRRIVKPSGCFKTWPRFFLQGGTTASNVVRIDQYYTSPGVVDAYHQTRREFFKGQIPPSTSNLHRRFARTQQSMEVQVWPRSPPGLFKSGMRRAPRLTRFTPVRDTVRR